MLRKLIENINEEYMLLTTNCEIKIINEFLSLMRTFQNNHDLEYQKIKDAFVNVLKKIIKKEILFDFK